MFTQTLAKMDEQYYKKHALLRYQLSKELERHRSANAEIEKGKAEQHIAPIFSATITIIVSFKFNDKCQILCTLNLIWQLVCYVLGAVILFCLLYFIGQKMLFPFFYKINRIIKEHLRPQNKSRNDRISPTEQAKRINQFNYDVFNLVYLTHAIHKYIQDEDPLIKSYYQSEELFYISRLNEKLKKIFADNKLENIQSHIPQYRIQVLFNLFRHTILSLQNRIDKGLSNDIYNEINTYNNLVEIINNTLYHKDIAEYIEN